MRHGLYLVKAKSGWVALAQYSRTGQLEEFLGVGQLPPERRPKRLTRKRIGESIGEWKQRMEQERTIRFYGVLAAGERPTSSHPRFSAADSGSRSPGYWAAPR